MAPTEHWRWVERASWVAGIVALVATLWQINRSADERTAATIDAFNKRLDAFHETLGERKTAYDTIEKKLEKTDANFKICRSQFAAEMLRRKGEEIASRPTSTAVVKMRSAEFAKKFEGFGLSNSSQTLAEQAKLFNTPDGLKWALPADQEFLKKRLAELNQPLAPFKAPSFPNLDKNMFTIPKPAEKTLWESFLEFIKKVPLGIGVLALIALANLFKK